jgi:hypothetical protein
LKIQQLQYAPTGSYEQTDGVSALLPEDKLIELYNIGNQTRKPMEVVQLHQTLYGAPIITVTYAAPTTDDKGRETTFNRTFLISLKDITNELVEALRSYFHVDLENLEPLELDKFTVSPHKNSKSRH